MSGARLDIALGLLALSLSAVAAQRMRDAVETASIPEPVVARAPVLPKLADADSLMDHEAMIVDNDLFRLSNRPSSVAFTLAPLPNVERAAPVRPPRPTLVVRAIMGGPPWLAVLDGLPGGVGDRVTVRQGDAFEKLVIRSVSRDTVIVQAPDTTWKLTMPRRQ